MVIWKFPLKVSGLQRVDMPYGAKVLTAQYQAGKLVAWAEVDEDACQSETFFLVVGTGEPFPDVDMKDYRYVGTVQELGYLVYHIYVEDLEQPHLQTYKITPA